MRRVSVIVSVPAILAAAAPASAATLFEQPGTTEIMEVPAALDFHFNAGAGAGLARFGLNGHRSLDGNNAWSDTFRVGLNGATILSGTYDLGGGSGGNRTDIAPSGAVISATSFGAWNGGRADFELPLALVQGMNVLSIGYEGGGQGLGDEGWSLSDLTITGTPGPAQPRMVEIFAQPTATGLLETPGSVAFDFISRGGMGEVDFDLNGFGSLDGNNGWSDVFTLSLNGVDLLSGTYDMGGGGGSQTFFAPVGSLVGVESFGSWSGGLGRFRLPLELVQGVNTLTLRYTGTPEGRGNEGWGISNLRVTEATNAVPEPATWLMLIAGFGFVGAAARRRRASTVLA